MDNFSIYLNNKNSMFAKSFNDNIILSSESEFFNDLEKNNRVFKDEC